MKRRLPGRRPAPGLLSGLRAVGLAGLLGMQIGLLQAEEYSFDASAFARKPVELAGQLDFKQEGFRLSRDSTFYKLNFYNKARPDSADRTTLIFKPEAKLRFGDQVSASFRGYLETQYGSLGDTRSNRFDEAYLSWQPATGLSIDAGKRALKWGKGYAWNPTGFVERAKDPNDPELAREGFSVLTADYTRNFEGPLQTLTFSPVLLPVGADVNKDFGRQGHVNVAARLYLLFMDTDIDFMVLNNGSRSRRYGFDFSRNLGSNLEVHGEWARVMDFQRQLTSATGVVSSTIGKADSHLIGLRYLSERETTYLLEYYRNGTGYTEEQLRSFADLVDNGYNQFQATGNDALLRRAGTLAQGSYGRPNAGRSYAYLRVSQKEPFDILYFTPAITLTTNLEDGSRSVVPEVVYTGITNVQLQARAFLLAGGANTDFGGKQNARRLELWAKLFF